MLVFKISVDPFQLRQVSRPAASHGLSVQKFVKDKSAWDRDADLVDVHDRVFGDTEFQALPDTMLIVLSHCTGLRLHQRRNGWPVKHKAPNIGEDRATLPGQSVGFGLVASGLGEIDHGAYLATVRDNL